MLFKYNNNLDSALLYMNMANRILPNNYYNLINLFETQLQFDERKAMPSALAFFHLDPSNPKICQDFMDICLSQNKDDFLKSFFEDRLKNETNDEVLGNLNFHFGQYYLGLDNLKTAKKYILASKANFEEVFPEKHQVFSVIEQVLQQIEKK